VGKQRRRRRREQILSERNLETEGWCRRGGAAAVGVFGSPGRSEERCAGICERKLRGHRRLAFLERGLAFGKLGRLAELLPWAGRKASGSDVGGEAASSCMCE